MGLPIPVTNWGYKNKWGADSEVKRPKGREEKEKVGKGLRRINHNRTAEDSEEEGLQSSPRDCELTTELDRAFTGDLVNSNVNSTVGQKPDRVQRKWEE